MRSPTTYPFRAVLAELLLDIKQLENVHERVLPGDAGPVRRGIQREMHEQGGLSLSGNLCLNLISKFTG